MSTSTIKNTSSKAAAAPKAAAAAPKATPKATPKAAAAPTDDRMSTPDYDKLIQAIRRDSLQAEANIQAAFLASWKDVACSHSCDRLNNLWDVLSETNSPFKTQVSLAMRALAGMANPMKSGQKWHRTGREPLSCTGDGWILNLEEEDKRVLKERAAWNIHFRAIQVKPMKSAFTWQECALFVKRIGTAAKQGRIPEKDRKKFQELLGEIERISAR